MNNIKLFESSNSNSVIDKSTISVLELHERILQQLVKGIAIFSFSKTNETIRHAIGTLNASLIPSKLVTNFGDSNTLAVFKALITANSIIGTAEPRTDVYVKKESDVEYWAKQTEEFLVKNNVPSKERKLSLDIQVFFDIEFQQWRSYKIDNLISLMVLTEDS